MNLLLHPLAFLLAWINDLLESHPILLGIILAALALYVLLMTLLGCAAIGLFSWAAITKQDLRAQKWL